MKKILKTLVLSLLTAALLCCTIPCAFAADSTTEKEPEIYTIDLDAMGGSSSVVALSTGLNGRLTALPEQPTLEGYSFDGWYTEPVGGTKISHRVYRQHHCVCALDGQECFHRHRSFCPGNSGRKPEDPGPSGSCCGRGCAAWHDRSGHCSVIRGPE